MARWCSCFFMIENFYQNLQLFEAQHFNIWPRIPISKTEIVLKHWRMMEWSGTGYKSKYSWAILERCVWWRLILVKVNRILHNLLICVQKWSKTDWTNIISEIHSSIKIIYTYIWILSSLIWILDISGVSNPWIRWDCPSDWKSLHVKAG